MTLFPVSPSGETHLPCRLSGETYLPCRLSGETHLPARLPALRLQIAGVPPQICGTLAGQRIISSLACSYLSDEIVDISPVSPAAESVEDAGQSSPTSSDARFRTFWAELEGKALQLVAKHSTQCSEFECADAAFSVAADGSYAELTRCVANPEVWLFGPALILALARRGIYCLHASAFSARGVATVVLGASGAGKSSLARAAANLPGMQRLCDDITPIHLENGQLRVLPRFPQLKLSVADLTLPESLPLKHLLVLQAATSSLPNEYQPLNDRGLFDAFTRHTVATRLFSGIGMRAWWGQLPQMIAAITHGHLVRPHFAADAPEQAMLNILSDLERASVLCG